MSFIRVCLPTIKFGHFGQTAAMTLGTAESRGEECFDQFPSERLADDEATQANHVHVVVFEWYPDQSIEWCLPSIFFPRAVRIIRQAKEAARKNTPPTTATTATLSSPRHMIFGYPLPFLVVMPQR